MFSGKIITGIEFKCIYSKKSIEVLGYKYDLEKMSEWVKAFYKNKSKEQLQLKYFNKTYNTCKKLGFKLTEKEKLQWNPKTDWANIERDIKLLELGYDPRPVARMNHDRMYEPFIQELIEMNKRGLLDTVNVYIRGKVFSRPILVYTNGSNNYANAQEAILYERAKARKQILKEP